DRIDWVEDALRREGRLPVSQRRQRLTAHQRVRAKRMRRLPTGARVSLPASSAQRELLECAGLDGALDLNHRSSAPPHSSSAPPHRCFVPPHRCFVPPHRCFVPPHRCFGPPHSCFVPPHRSFVPPHRSFVLPHRFRFTPQQHT